MPDYILNTQNYYAKSTLFTKKITFAKQANSSRHLYTPFLKYLKFVQYCKKYFVLNISSQNFLEIFFKQPSMNSKLTRQINQTLKVGGKNGNIENFKMEQELSIYQNPSKKPRQRLSINIHEKKIFKCDICSKSFKQRGHFKTHIESVHGGKHLNVTFVHQVLHKKVQ